MYVHKLLSMLCIFLVPEFVWGVHSPLLPRPQQIHYGQGAVPLQGLKLVFSFTPGEEDKFAAQNFSEYVQQRTGIQLSVGDSKWDGGGSGSIRLERLNATDQPLALPEETPGPHSREAYDLIVSAQGVKIDAASSAGLFYGLETLRQLVEGQGSAAALPQVEIHDWPSLAYRGTMVDISHGPLPTETEIKRELDFLSKWKANQYYLYSEASIELTGYPLLNPGARLTKDEVRRIVVYGRQRHIDVIPNLELYAHLHDLFRIEQYSELSDQPHGTELDPSNAKVMPLLTDWVNQFTEMFPSPFVNIGFDETFQIQAGSPAIGASNSPTALFVKQLGAVTRLFQAHGKKVIAWDDIMVKFPQIIPDLPPGLTAVAWYYTPEDPTYNKWLGPLVANHVPHFVQPGVTSYDDISPNYDITFKNIDTFLAAGRKSGALGLINSIWADDAQLFFRMSLPGMAYGAAAPWQSSPMVRAEFFADYASVMYPAEVAPYVTLALQKMSESETTLEKVVGDQTMFALWWDPFFPAHYAVLDAHREDLRQVRLLAEQAETALLSAISLAGDKATLNSLLLGSHLLDYAGEKFQTPLDLTDLWKKMGSSHPDADKWWNEWESQVTHYDHSYILDLMDRISDLRPSYQAEWLQEYAPYRLNAALGRWDGEFQYWRNIHEKLREFNDVTHVGDPLPPLYQIIEKADPPQVRPR